MITIDIKHLKPAKRYASALMAIGRADDILRDLNIVNDTIFSNEEYRNFFKHPVINIFDKKEALREIFEGKIDTEVLNLLYLLLDNGRFEIFPLITDVYNKDVQKSKNIISAEVSSAVELTDEEKTALNNKLNEKLNKQVLLDFHIDESIIAGLVIKIEDNVIDLSLKTKFEKLKKA